MHPDLEELATKPSLQFWHEVELANAYWFHAQASQALDPAELNVPTGHTLQSASLAFPSSELYVPAGHGCGIVKFPLQ